MAYCTNVQQFNVFYHFVENCQVDLGGYLVLFVTFRYLLMPASLQNLIVDVLSLNWDLFLSMTCSAGG